MFYDILFAYGVQRVITVIAIAIIVGLFLAFVAPFSGASNF